MFVYRRRLYSLRLWVFDQLVLYHSREAAMAWARVSGLRERIEAWSRSISSRPSA
jgi:hypothetical protein